MKKSWERPVLESLNTEWTEEHVMYTGYDKYSSDVQMPIGFIIGSCCNSKPAPKK